MYLKCAIHLNYIKHSYFLNKKIGSRNEFMKRTRHKELRIKSMSFNAKKKKLVIKMHKENAYGVEMCT